MNEMIFMNVDDLNDHLSLSQKLMKNAEDEIKNLKEKKSRMENLDFLEEEKEDLLLTHQLIIEDIKIYKEKISKLKEEVKSNETRLLNLREENEKLKKEKNINEQESNEDKNVILNFVDLYKSTKIKRKTINLKENDNNINNNKINNEKNKKMENIEIINKKKEEYEKILVEIKNKANQIYSVIKKQNEILNKDRYYLNEINSYLTKFTERLSVSVKNKVINNK